MSEIASASVGYDDLVGEIRVDGFGHVQIAFDIPRAGIPKNYLPVALEIYYSATEQGEKDIHISALAVDADILDVVSADGIRKYIQKTGRLPVHYFETEMTLEQLMPKVKRLKVLLRDSSTEDAPLVIIRDN